MDGTDELKPNEIGIEIDGPDLHPETAPTAQLLRLAAEFFDLVERAAGSDLNLTGVTIVDKCALVKAQTDDAAAAGDAVRLTRQLLAGLRSPASGEKGPRDRFRVVANRLPPNTSIRDWVGQSSEVVEVSAAESPIRSEVTSLRVTVLRVGGTNTVARVTSLLYPSTGQFSLQCTQEDARRLGTHLYGEADVVARLDVDGHGVILSGEIIECTPVDASADPVAAWRSWFADHGSRWNRVENIEAELEHD